MGYDRTRAKSIVEGKGWLYGNLITIDEHTYLAPDGYFRLDGHHIVCDSDVPVFIDEDTICNSIGYCDSNGNEIFTGDIVEFGDFCRVLVWFCKELNCMTAVTLDKNTYFNGFDYHNDKVTEDFCEFCVMLQDHYGDFQRKIRIMGNVFDNAELVKDIKKLNY